MTRKTIQLILEKLLGDKISIFNENKWEYKNYKIIFLDKNIQIIKNDEPHALLENENDLFKYFMVYVSSNEGLKKFEKLFFKENELHYKELAYLKRIQNKRHKDTTIKDIYNQLMFSNKNPKILGEELNIESNFIKKLKNHERKNIINKIVSHFMEIKAKLIYLDDYDMLENKIDNFIVYYKSDETYLSKLYIIGSLIENCVGEGETLEKSIKKLKESLEEIDIVLI